MGRQRGAGRKPTERWGYTSVADMAQKLPRHFKPIADTPTLIEEERDSLAQCEAAIESLKVAFWAAGKALQIVRDGRLYRASYDSFDAYCTERWDIGRDYADRLIKAWPVAEKLASEGTDAVRRLNESQMRVLLPVAARHGDEAAVLVYRTVEEVGGGAVTADALKGAVRSLQQIKEFDAGRAEAVIRAALEKAPGKKPERRPKEAASGAAGTARTADAHDLQTVLPWDSPGSLNTLLRRYMSEEDRRVLAKLLAED